jgi:hypothetical protein
VRNLAVAAVALIIVSASAGLCGANAGVDDSIRTTRLVETVGSYPGVHLLYYGVDLHPKIVHVERRQKLGRQNNGYSLWLRCTGDRLMDSLGVGYLPFYPPGPPHRPEREPYESQHRLHDSIERTVGAKAARYGWSDERQMACRVRLYRKSPLVKAVQATGADTYKILWANRAPKLGWEYVQFVHDHLDHDRTSAGNVEWESTRLMNYLPMQGAIVMIDRGGVHVCRENDGQIQRARVDGYAGTLPSDVVEHLRNPDLLAVLRGER